MISLRNSIILHKKLFKKSIERPERKEDKNSNSHGNRKCAENQSCFSYLGCLFMDILFRTMIINSNYNCFPDLVKSCGDSTKMVRFLHSIFFVSISVKRTNIFNQGN